MQPSTPGLLEVWRDACLGPATSSGATLRLPRSRKATGGLKGPRSVLTCPELPHHLVSGLLRPIAQSREQLVSRLAAVERCDEWLNDCCRAVERAGIAPGFEKVRLRHVPMAQRRRLIVVQAEMNAQRDLAQRIGELEIHGRGVDRVPTQDDEHFDHSGVHVRDQVSQRQHLIDRLSLDWIGVHDRPTDVPKGLVHRVGDRVHDRRLAVASDDQTRAASGSEVLCDRRDPEGLRDSDVTRHRHTDCLSQRPRNRVHLARPESKSMVSACSR